MKIGPVVLVATLLLAPHAGFGQGVTKEMLLKPPADSWPMYNGDYSGRRFSNLKVIDDSNVQNLSIAWIGQVTAGSPANGGNGGGGSISSSTPLLVNGILYFSSLDNVWSMDARTGRVLWHYYRQDHGPMPRGSSHGVGMYGNWIYVFTADDFLVSLDATTGKQRWIVSVADPYQYYFSTSAPMIVGDHVLVGTGGDSLDIPGFLQSRDPETGDLQWTSYSTPRPGQPGIETWPDEYSASHGGGGPWVPGTYDPELNLYYYGTGNTNPVMAGQSRKGDNLYTCTILAINPDTGKMAWYFQSSPHDTHDWDAVQTPVLFDGVIDGNPRKLLAQASRNGYFFVVDRTNGKNIVSKPFIETLNWSKGLDAKGQPIPNPAKEPSLGGVLVSPSGGATNWPPPSFSPQTGLFYVGTDSSFSISYLTDTDDHPEGYGGKGGGGGPGGRAALRALDYKTGKLVWKHEWPGGGECLRCLQLPVIYCSLQMEAM